ncbi:MAG: SufE family protein [Planctomycetota bacterium]
MTDELTIDEIYEEFDELPDWKDRCDYLIDLGFDLPELPEEAKTEENRVHGCQSNVWMIAEVEPDGPRTIKLRAMSDSIIVSGLIVILLTLYSGKTPAEIAAIDPKETFERLGLERYLSSQRRNGLYGMVQRVRELSVKIEAGL